MSKETVLTFPTSFPIKVMGDAKEDIQSVVEAALAEHLEGDKTDYTIASRHSKAGNYISVTATFTATSRAQLDDLYEMISSDKRVKMVL